VLALDPAQNNTFRAVNRSIAAGLDVQIATVAGGMRYLLPGLSEEDQDQLVKSFALVAERTSAAGRPLQRPRIGLHDVPNSIDAGWTRWVLEQYGFNFVLVSSTDVAAGALANIDVLIVTDEPGGFAASAAASTSQVAAVDDFVRRGGTLVCLNRSSSFAIDHLKLPVKNVLAGLDRQEFFTGGSLLQVRTDPTHPVMAGMPPDAAVFVQSSPAFDVQDGFRGTVLAHYASSGSPLLSGYLVGEKYLNGKTAALDVEHGGGHVILIGFRPQWRGQPFGTFRVLFNAALYAHADTASVTQPPR
jgi:ribosomal protein S18 acetylase RimI-like enzyme